MARRPTTLTICLMKPDAPPDPETAQSVSDYRPIKGAVLRWLLIGFGFLNVVIGVIGIVVPGLPTTVFLLVAAWAFSRSSERFQQWLLTHPTLGPLVRDWRDHRVIPKRAKIIAATMMTLSLTYVIVYVASDWILPTIMAAIMIPALIYIVTRSGSSPTTDEDLQ